MSSSSAKEKEHGTGSILGYAPGLFQTTGRMPNCCRGILNFQTTNFSILSRLRPGERGGA